MKIEEKYFYDNALQKNSVEDVLNSGEKVLWQGKPNAKSYVLAAMVKMLPIAIIWMLFDGFALTAIITGLIKEQMDSKILWFIVPFFLLHLTPVWIWLANIIKATREVKNLEYAITDKRIIIRSGMIGIDFKFINYTEIDSVNVKVGLIDKIFKVGDIYINSSVNSGVLWDVSNPYGIGRALQKVTTDIKSDIHYPNALRPDNNPGYKTGYDENPFDDMKF